MFSKKTLTRRHFLRKVPSSSNERDKLNPVGRKLRRSISRHSEKLYPQTDRNHAFLKIPLPPDGSRHTRQPSDTAEPQSCFPQSRSWFPTQRSGRPQPRSGHSRGRSGKPNQRSGKLRPWSGFPKRRSEPLKQRICPKIAQNHQKPALAREIHPFSRITD